MQHPYQSLFISYSDLGITPEELKRQIMIWAAQFPVVAAYESNGQGYRYGGFKPLIGVSSRAENGVSPEGAFTSLKSIWPQENRLLLGILAYDLKNQVEKLESRHPDRVGFPLMYFFCPETYFTFETAGFTIFSQTGHPNDFKNAILAIQPASIPNQEPIRIQERVKKNDYLNQVNLIREDIRNGEFYEMNYCQEFYAENVNLPDPVSVYFALQEASPMPFSGFFKINDRYLLCASPERFIKKEENKLISQPIKGTTRRGNTPAEDQKLREALRRNEKEMAENMMIMDLVRNDLNRSCAVGSVQVEEMFGIYPFRQVYQMITTVTGNLRPDCHPVEAIQNAFPMGSMTGAPKIRAMQLIDRYETSRRGLFSGSLGYLLPNGDFDFNVIIRSLQYNGETGYLSFSVGSAITFDSDPEQEYQECLLKAQAIRSILAGSGKW